MEFRKASVVESKARIAIEGGPGTGKTYGMLLLASGLAGPSGRVAVIDTERGRSEQYATKANFDVLVLDPPFSPRRYIEALQIAFDAKYDVVCLDSFSHLWAGVGGVLESVNNQKGNSYTAWKVPSAEYQRVIDMIVRSPTHVIVTLRTKMAYELVEENGKKVPQKVGMAPIARDGSDYEFDVVLDIDTDHNAKLSKCNAAYSEVLSETLCLDKRITPTLGAKLRQWITSAGKPVTPAVEPAGLDSAAIRALRANEVETARKIHGPVVGPTASGVAKPNSNAATLEAESLADDEDDEAVEELGSAFTEPYFALSADEVVARLFPSDPNPTQREHALRIAGASSTSFDKGLTYIAINYCKCVLGDDDKVKSLFRGVGKLDGQAASGNQIRQAIAKLPIQQKASA